MQCCTDPSCERHLQMRKDNEHKSDILNDRTVYHIKAKEIRNKAVKKARFREPGFLYAGDTVIIWDIYQFARNKQWCDEASRKSIKRQARLEDTLDLDSTPRGRKRRKFRDLVEEWYQRSLSNN